MGRQIIFSILLLLTTDVATAAMTDVETSAKTQTTSIILTEPKKEEVVPQVVPTPALSTTPIAIDNPQELVPASAAPIVPAPVYDETPAPAEETAASEEVETSTDEASESSEVSTQQNAASQAIPETAQEFLDQKITPKAIRINLEGYNIRSTSSFGIRDTNIAWKSEYAQVLPVTRIKKLYGGSEGVAIGVCLQGSVVNGKCVRPNKEHFVFVPLEEKYDFNLCTDLSCNASTISQGLNVMSSSFASLEVKPPTGCNQSLLGHPVEMDTSPAAPTSATLPAEFSQIAPKQVRGMRSDDLQMKPLWEKAKKPKASTGTEWTNMLLDSIKTYGKNLTDSQDFADKKQWCPNWTRLSPSEKTEFWVHMFNGVAAKESNFNTKTTFDEKTRHNIKKGRVNPDNYSQGLFQLSYGSADQKAYRNFCKFDKEADSLKDVSDPSLTIYDPKKQMDCAVGMMNHLVGQNDAIGSTTTVNGKKKYKGGARFWSTMRDSNAATREVKENVRNFTPCWK